MYSTCIFCHSGLGTNDSVEHFPIGRRLAFDAARGRLWVVCRKCERWNLTPLDERWEAIEECERGFRDTRLRMSTDNIGLARLRDGLELVRIGSPQRPEMAAWRYGDQFGRRRKKHLAFSGFAAAGAGILIFGPATGIIAGGSWGLWNLISTGTSVYQQRRVRARLVIPDVPDPVAIRFNQLYGVSIVPDDTHGWALHVPFTINVERPAGGMWLRPWARFESGPEYEVRISGDDAVRAAGKLLPALNAAGASRDQVLSAVGIMEEATDPNALFARYKRAPSLVVTPSATPAGGSLLSRLPKEVRLALEMAAHEESERQALAGELSLLEDAWKEAEEIAAIADDLFVPEETRERLSALKRPAGEG